jgi:RND family efflux transporter MFP subunit
VVAEKLEKDDVRQLLTAIHAGPSLAEEMPRRGSNWAIAFLVLLIAVGCIAALFYFRQPNANSAPALATKKASATAAKGGNVQSGAAGGSVLDASGYVFATRQATVSSETTGRLAHVYIEEGSNVTKGQLLADIDSNNVLVQIALAEAELESARKAFNSAKIQRDEGKNKLERTRRLVVQGFLSKQQLDTDLSQLDFLDAQSASRLGDIDVSKKRLLIQQQQLKNTRILAPFDGLVVEQSAQVGEIVSPISAGGGFTRTGICTLLDINSLGVQVNVSEQFIGKVRKGQDVTIRVPAYPDIKLKGVLGKIMPAASRETAAVKVQIDFVERDARVLPNMSVNVSFQR